MSSDEATPSLVICIDNVGYPASLERGKVYRTLADPDAEAHGLRRVIDESGEDYLYPAASFMPVVLPAAVVQALNLAVA
jgi:hypothetical protein